VDREFFMMTESAIPAESGAVSRLKLFFALSRTPHGLLDMCTPAFAALLWLGALPTVPLVLLGLVTTFAGYTAVYALNDLVDYRIDREKAAYGTLASGGSDLDGWIIRHPMAQGLLGFKAGLAWTLFWAVVALTGAFMLNPVCVFIFTGGCVLEAVYCRLWRISPFRTLVSGAVKTSGALAAVFAVDPRPSALFLALLFLTLFLWEIGGQNIPNDLTDLEEDRRLGARTIPICFGAGRAVLIAGVSLAGATMLTVVVVLISPLKDWGVLALLPLAAACYLLIGPAMDLVRNQDRDTAMRLFNRASYYPATMLLIVLLAVLI
jgi:4-hydroxybenzoate polyprenyltransferase